MFRVLSDTDLDWFALLIVGKEDRARSYWLLCAIRPEAAPIIVLVER